MAVIVSSSSLVMSLRAQVDFLSRVCAEWDSASDHETVGDVRRRIEQIPVIPARDGQPPITFLDLGITL